jgi:hypothetical protein
VTPFNQENFGRFVEFIFNPVVAAGGCVELVVWGGVVSRKSGLIIPADFKGAITGGWFSSAKLLALSARSLSGVSGYVTFNPINIDKLSHVCNKVDRIGKGEGTKESDVISTLFFLIDIDVSMCNELISATAGELDGCVEVRNKIWEKVPGIAENSVSGVSGNGAFVLVSSHRATKANVRAYLMRLSEAFGKKGRDAVHIDPGPCFSNAHIGLPGTKNARGPARNPVPIV